MSNNLTQNLNINGADLALKLERLLKRLITCMTQETLAMQCHNHEVSGKMAQEKTMLMNNYRNLHKDLLANPDIIRNADTDIQNHLKTIIAEFEVVLCDNIKAVYSGRNAVGRLINRILQKARDTASPSHKHYNAKGQMVDGDLKSGMTPVRINDIY